MAGHTATAADALPLPGPIGRAVRLLLGLVALYLCLDVLRSFPQLRDGVNVANPIVWLALAYVLYALPAIVRMAFSLTLPARHVRMAMLGLLMLVAAVDLYLGGDPNGRTVGLAFGLLVTSVLGILGLSFLVAAAAAAPG